MNFSHIQRFKSRTASIYAVEQLLIACVRATHTRFCILFSFMTIGHTGPLHDFSVAMKNQWTNEGNNILHVIFYRWWGVCIPNCSIGEVVTVSRVWGPHPLNLPLLFWTPFGHSGTTVVLLQSGVCLAIWPFHIHTLVGIFIRFLNVHPSSLIQVKFLRLQQVLSATYTRNLPFQRLILCSSNSSGLPAVQQVIL